MHNFSTDGPLLLVAKDRMGTSEAGRFNVFFSFLNGRNENVCFNCYRSPESNALELFDSLEIGETYVLRRGDDQQSVYPADIQWAANEGDEILTNISFDKY